jgi:hypothetical protein
MKTLLFTSLLILASNSFATIRSADISFWDQDELAVLSEIDSTEARVDLLYPSPEKNMCGLVIRAGSRRIKADEILKKLIILVDDFSRPIDSGWLEVGSVVKNKIVAPKPDLESFPYIQIFRVISRDSSKTL